MVLPWPSVRRKPYAVILFDEIEKAHPDVFNVLLQTLDDGRLTDGQGRTIDFKNTLIIMTSNLGSQFMQESDELRKKELIMDVVRHTFKPEFLNRVDEIVLFNNLGLDQIKVIVDIQLALLERRLADRKLSIALTDAAREFIVKHGYDPVYGARPLKRAIQRYIQDSLALKILEGEFKEGDTVNIDYDRSRNSLRFETAGKKRSAKAV